MSVQGEDNEINEQEQNQNANREHMLRERLESMLRERLESKISQNQKLNSMFNRQAFQSSSLGRTMYIKLYNAHQAI